MFSISILSWLYKGGEEREDGIRIVDRGYTI